MPDIPLSPVDLQFVPAVQVLIRAILLWPKDRASICSYLALYDRGDPNSKLVNEVNLKYGKRSIRGGIVGEVFIRLLSLKVHRPEDASVGKAVFLVSRALECKHLVYEGIGAVATTIDPIHNSWVEFRPVAHLWAAHHYLRTIGPMWSESDEGPPDFYHSLLFSEALFRQAQAVGWAFDPDPWVLPANFPGKSDVIPFTPPEPVPWEIETLKKYRAPSRPKVDPG